ncbi:hypothetical protein CAEBREN_15863 [Caenorhabditis brenneri]|uniref:MATH domain-containing protein n=1 Tax=Caenorhabditis brenneri TaxID=135651 RepID=G0MV38_CAEBE|nr:hypothetical protein CAEBREN_15863 [Caenorhabditis brenneri]
MSGTERSFVLKYRFKNVSNIKNTKKSYSDYEDHFGVPWRLSIKNNENHLGVHLYCGRSEKEKEWSIDTEFEIHILHPKENSFHEFTYLLNCFTNAIGRGPSRIMTWERMEKEFLQNDELVVEIRVKINEITGIEDVNLNMPETVDKLPPVEKQTDQKTDDFVLKHVFKNVSKIKEFGCRYSPTEDHSGIQWNILIHNRKDHLEVILYCGRPGNKSEWSVDIEYEIHVLHPNGNPAHKNSAVSHRFTEAIRRGPKEIMTWERMEKEFLLNDELAVEICVKIIKMTGAESIVYLNPRPRSFVLKHAFKNVSKMRDTEDCKGPIQYHFIAPWFIGIRNENKHLGVHLYCGRSKNKKEWSIDTEFEVHVFHPNGNPVQENSAISHCFAVASGYGPSDLMTWERMEKEFLLNDELVVEIRVTITNFTGIEGFHLNMSETDDKLSIVEKQTNQKTDNFVLKHVFKNVSTMDDEGCYGPTEDHFGVSWYVFINHEKEHLAVFLRCARSKNKKEWSIDTDFEIHVLHPNGNPVHKSSISSVFTNDFPCGRNLMTWERMEREFLLNDELVVEIRVKIIQMAGTEV